jgi:hypothetical protein
MILAGHQPCYLPGIQLFNKIALSDVFMHCGHLQYQSKSWHSHNFIRTCELIVPVHKTFGDQINQVTIADGRWRRKHVKAIELAYQGFRFFDAYFPRLKDILMGDWTILDTLNRKLIDAIVEWLGFKTKIVDGAQWHFEGDAVGKIIEMCHAVGADEYISNEGAQAYIHYPQEELMLDAGIKHRWQKFNHPVYGQDTQVNDGRLSVIDLLFRLGPGARPIIENSGSIA